jgi:hypothetical protein
MCAIIKAIALLVSSAELLPKEMLKKMGLFLERFE